MIERGDADLLAWLQPLAGDATIDFDLPPVAAPATSLMLNAHLFDIDRPPAVASTRQPPIELKLGYLVSAWGPNAAAHALLGRVLVAALAHPAYEVELGAPVAAVWGALAGPRRAAFIVRLRVAQDRGLPAAPMVRAPARVDTVALSTLRGRVQASDGQPIVDAVVAIPVLARSTATGTDGTFSIAGIPRTLDVRLHVRAKGVEMDVERSAAAMDEQLIITVSV